MGEKGNPVRRVNTTPSILKIFSMPSQFKSQFDLFLFLFPSILISGKIGVKISNSKYEMSFLH